MADRVPYEQSVISSTEVRAVANGVKMGRKRTWDEGLANTVR